MSTRPDSQAEAPEQGTLLLVANYAPDVGFAWWLMEVFWIRFAQLSRRCGLKPLIAYPVPGKVPEDIRSAAIETLIQPFPAPGLRGIIDAWRLVRSRRVKCIYFTDRDYSSFTYLLLRLAGVRLLLNHDHTPGDRPPIRGLKGALKALWRRLPGLGCDRQICVSPLIRDRAIANARIPAHRAVVVQNGIRVQRRGAGKAYIREQFGISEHAKICISVARATPYKRIDFVIEVARRCLVDQQLSDLVFVFCGDGLEMDRLRKQAAHSGLTDTFIFAGRRSDVPQLLEGADFALHPSRGEAFSLAIVEYMSAGLVVLVPDIPTVCQAVTHDVTGIVYRDGDADQVAECLAHLIADPERCARISRAAEDAVRRYYTIEEMSRQFDSVIWDALREAGLCAGQVDASAANHPQRAGK